MTLWDGGQSWRCSEERYQDVEEEKQDKKDWLQSSARPIPSACSLQEFLNLVAFPQEPFKEAFHQGAWWTWTGPFTVLLCLVNSWGL